MEKKGGGDNCDTLNTWTEESFTTFGTEKKSIDRSERDNKFGAFSCLNDNETIVSFGSHFKIEGQKQKTSEAVFLKANENVVFNSESVQNEKSKLCRSPQSRNTNGDDPFTKDGEDTSWLAAMGKSLEDNKVSRISLLS